MCDHNECEAAMSTVAVDAAGKPTVWCDPCLAPLVKALNDGGISTVASCCGHGTHVGSVALSDGRWIVVMTAEDWASFDNRRGMATDADQTPVERFADLAADQFRSNLDYDGAEVKRRILTLAHVLAPDHPKTVAECSVCRDDEKVDEL